MAKTSELYIYITFIVFLAIVILLLLTDNIQLNFFNKQEGFKSLKDTNKNIEKFVLEMKYRNLFFDYDKETGWSKEINMEKIDTRINIFKNLQEIDNLKLLADLQSSIDKPSDSSKREKVIKTLKDYNKNKIMYKDLIEYLENIRTKGSSSSSGIGMEGIEEEGEEEEEDGFFGF